MSGMYLYIYFNGTFFVVVLQLTHCSHTKCAETQYNILINVFYFKFDWMCIYVFILDLNLHSWLQNLSNALYN